MKAVVQPATGRRAVAELAAELIAFAARPPRGLQVRRDRSTSSRNSPGSHRQALQAPVARPVLERSRLTRVVSEVPWQTDPMGLSPLPVRTDRRPHRRAGRLASTCSPRSARRSTPPTPTWSRTGSGAVSPTWEHAGILCNIETYKEYVKLTFAEVYFVPPTPTASSTPASRATRVAPSTSAKVRSSTRTH